jgi:hypothetical protein
MCEILLLPPPWRQKFYICPYLGSKNITSFFGSGYVTIHYSFHTKRQMPGRLRMSPNPEKAITAPGGPAKGISTFLFPCICPGVAHSGMQGGESM